MENREVAVVDVPGAFMQADMDSIIHVRFTGKMVELLLEIDHDIYAPYVTIERNKEALYFELLKSLYDTVCAARLCCDKLSSKLKLWGFKANSYDSFVVNKMVNGKQLALEWHVDNLKISQNWKRDANAKKSWEDS
jgi:hypothetical protein